jgi:Putative beta-barrel porin-2, OmpL-like. bbp2
LTLCGAAAFAATARAADAPPLYAKALPAGRDCQAPDAPYKNYACLDPYLGDAFLSRFINYYRLEWGHDAAPSDPKAPSARRQGWPDAPQASPPMPFTEWPYGGATAIGVTRPASVDGPLMVALANTDLGRAMSDGHVQVYGWVNGGGNLSTDTVRPGGNFPAAYMYTPNTVTLDQAVINVERLPDTVQQDHVDWGFRFSALYGENYRYTTSYGIASYQLLGHDLVNGYDFPMAYGELYVPWVGEGLLLRLGRYLSIPDIESQYAPYSYMYSRSMTYAFDAFTNSGLLGTLAVTKNWFLQLGVTIGSDAAPWHWGQTVANPFPNPVFPGTTMPRDPGAVPSITAAVRYQSDSGKDAVYLTMNGVNSGLWGYDNLQWFGGTYYHKFDDRWHLSFEMYTSSQRNVLNGTGANAEAAQIIANGGYPFTLANGFNFNAPGFAACSAAEVTCTARTVAAVAYLNYKVSALDNISLRPEFFDDMNGQRTGVKTRYANIGLGWQHWFSPQIELRPEIAYYHSLDANAFNGNLNAIPASAGGGAIAPTRNFAWIAAADLILHF